MRLFDPGRPPNVTGLGKAPPVAMPAPPAPRPIERDIRKLDRFMLVVFLVTGLLVGAWLMDLHLATSSEPARTRPAAAEPMICTCSPAPRAAPAMALPHNIAAGQP